jgi:3-phenylpropionate/trans-cinnamate dioxygenase ferredoxin subunit
VTCKTRFGSATCCAPAHLPVPKFPVKIEDGAVWTRDDRS